MLADLLKIPAKPLSFFSWNAHFGQCFMLIHYTHEKQAQKDLITPLNLWLFYFTELQNKIPEKEHLCKVHILAGG